MIAGESPSSLAFDGPGNLYIAEYVNNRVRRVDAVTGVISTTPQIPLSFSTTGGYAEVMSRTRAVMLWVFGESKSPNWRTIGLIIGYTGMRPFLERHDGTTFAVSLFFLVPGAIAFIASAKRPVSEFNELLRYLLLAFLFALLFSGGLNLFCHVWPRSSGCPTA
jgi:hypothetical protein